VDGSLWSRRCVHEGRALAGKNADSSARPASGGQSSNSLMNSAECPSGLKPTSFSGLTARLKAVPLQNRNLINDFQRFCR
jgi:hypothetical protein